MNGDALAPLALLVVVVAIDVWVYLDARGRSFSGEDVVATVGPLTLSTPSQWLVAILLVWIFLAPLCLVAT